MGAEITMNGKIENGFTQNTKVTLPIYLQIVILFSVISLTITAVLGYASQISKDEKHDTSIQELKETKLDKSRYESDQNLQKLQQEINGRKLDAIMKKLNIDNF